MKNRVVSIALPTLLVACAAQADLCLHYEGYGHGDKERMSVNMQLEWDQTSSSEVWWDLRTYEHLWLDQETGDNYISQCIQIYAGIDIGETYCWTVGEVSQNELRREVMMDLYARNIDTTTGGVYEQGTVEETNQFASAFQIMVWEIMHENFEATTADDLLSQISIDTGSIQWDATGSAGALGYFDMIYGNLGDGGWQESDVDGWFNDSAQNQANYQVIPAPAAIAALTLGMGGMVRRRRR